METVCPLECVNVGCDEADFIEKHGTFVLTVVGVVSGTAGMFLTYFLKSRCKHIKCWGIECTRDVLTLDPKNIEIQS